MQSGNRVVFIPSIPKGHGPRTQPLSPPARSEKSPVAVARLAVAMISWPWVGRRGEAYPPAPLALPREVSGVQKPHLNRRSRTPGYLRLTKALSKGSTITWLTNPIGRTTCCKG